MPLWATMCIYDLLIFIWAVSNQQIDTRRIISGLWITVDNLVSQLHRILNLRNILVTWQITLVTFFLPMINIISMNNRISKEEKREYIHRTLIKPKWKTTSKVSQKCKITTILSIVGYFALLTQNISFNFHSNKVLLLLV